MRGPETACGRSEGDCCHQAHLAAERFASEREAASLVPVVVEYVRDHPGCSARALYSVLIIPRARTKQGLLRALSLAESQGLVTRQRIGKKLQRYWAAQ